MTDLCYESEKKINLKPHTEKNQQNSKLQEFSAYWLRFVDLIDRLYLGENKIRIFEPQSLSLSENYFCGTIEVGVKN